MTQETTLVLEFLDEDGTTKTVTIKNPKEDLTREAVNAVMQTIIDEDALLTNAGKHLSDINNCYYRTVTTDELEFASQGE